MDPETELQFLKELNERKALLLCKDNTLEAKKKRRQCWEDLRNALNLKTMSSFTLESVMKKWNNVQGRIRKRKQYQNGVTGGRFDNWPRNDLYVMEVLLGLDPSEPLIQTSEGGDLEEVVRMGSLGKAYLPTQITLDRDKLSLLETTEQGLLDSTLSSLNGSLFGDGKPIISDNSDIMAATTTAVAAALMNGKHTPEGGGGGGRGSSLLSPDPTERGKRKRSVSPHLQTSSQEAGLRLRILKLQEEALLEEAEIRKLKKQKLLNEIANQNDVIDLCLNLLKKILTR